LLIHGDRDEIVSPVHAERLAGRLRESGVPHFFLRLPWATHGCDRSFSGPCGQLSTYAVEQFLGAIMKPAREADGGPSRFNPLTTGLR
jgi:acetyl esterase/lipase